MAALDRAQPRIDKNQAEQAVALHFRRVGLEVPIRWVPDAENGYQETLGAKPNHKWQGLERLADSLCGDLAWPARARVWPLAWTPAESVVRDLTQRAVAAKTGVAPMAAWSAAGRVVLLAGWLAAGPSAQRSYEREQLQRSLDTWWPFLDAYEAGLWLFWVLESEIVAVARPSLHTENGRLHRADGPAVSWLGGRAFYFMQGTRVPERVVLDPSSLTAAEILLEENVEVQRVCLERFGYDRLILETGASPVHADEFGVLYRVRLRRRRPIALVHVTNSTPEPDGTRRQYFLRVPPDVRTAREAVAWTFGLRAEEYQPASET